MDALVVVAHPATDSFGHALAQAVVDGAKGAGASVKLQDLYADGFDPRMPAAEVGTTTFADDLTARYAAELLTADVVVVVHPVWFFHVPAILKGWVDRVVREDVAYRLGSGGESEGLLQATRALVVNTANSPAAVEEAMGDPLEVFWGRAVFGSGGVKDVQRLRFAKVAGSSAAQREGWLAEASAAAQALVNGSETR